MKDECIDVTPAFHLYREAARHVWNSCFASRTDVTPSGTHYEAFDRICEALFGALILDPVGSRECSSQLNVQGFASVRVIPAIVDGTPILINRTNPTGPYWDDPLRIVTASELNTGLIGSFDWNSHGLIDMRYLRVRILSCSTNLAIAGREALIEMDHARVVVLKETAIAPPG